MNWAMFGLAITAVLAAVWLYLVLQKPRSLASFYVSLGFLLTAALNTAAPFRGAVDPAYVGYTFGLLSAPKGLMVTAVAGAVLVAATACAYIAARNRPGQAMGLVLAGSLAGLVVTGWPWLRTVLTDPSGNSIQLGEYLTIPGLLGSLLLGALTVGPFLVGVPWAWSRMRAGKV